MDRSLVWILATAGAVAAAGSTLVWAQNDAAMPRDRQVIVERTIGHLSPVDEVDCVQRSRIAETIIVNDQRILYRASRNLVYENNLTTSCEGMARSPYLPATRHNRSQICAGDVIELVSPGRTASCTLGHFRVLQYRRPGDPLD
jgi:hypothetical protein